MAAAEARGGEGWGAASRADRRGPAARRGFPVPAPLPHPRPGPPFARVSAGHPLRRAGGRGPRPRGAVRAPRVPGEGAWGAARLLCGGVSGAPRARPGRFFVPGKRGEPGAVRVTLGERRGGGGTAETERQRRCAPSAPQRSVPRRSAAPKWVLADEAPGVGVFCLFQQCPPGTCACVVLVQTPEVYPRDACVCWCALKPGTSGAF